MKPSVKYFISKSDESRRKLRTSSELLKKSLKKNFIFCAVAANFQDLLLMSNYLKKNILTAAPTIHFFFLNIGIILGKINNTFFLVTLFRVGCLNP